MLNKDSPASSSGDQTHYLVGQDPSGMWLAVEIHDRGGGFFRSRAAALHFVDFETGHRAGAVDLATAPLQLKF